MKRTLLLSIFMMGTFAISKAQVGIGTLTPDGSAELDITSTDKGILIPRVTLTGTGDTSTISGTEANGLMVYNTATAGSGLTAVTPGFYFWGGSQWVRFTSGDPWFIDGNSGTTSGTNFIGTTDAQALDFRTNNTLRFRIANGDQVYAGANGSRSAPFYSWDGDTNTGIWRPGADQLAFGAGNREFIRFREASDDVLVINEESRDMDVRIETDGDTETLYIDGANNNIGISTTAPDASASLELNDGTRGLLLNRVALTATNAASPVTSPAAGLVVYNTATASSGSTEVTPGMYYWDGSQWIAMGGTNGRDWSLEGNAGTNPSNNFAGTTDAVDFALRTNDSERARITSAGDFVIGATAPTGDNVFEVQATTATEDAISGYSTAGGIGIYGTDTTTGVGVFGQAGGAGVGTIGAAANASGFGGLIYNTSATGVGMVGSGNGSGLGFWAGTGGTFNGSDGVAGGADALGTGVIGVGNAGTIAYTLLPNGSGVSGASDDTGVYGFAYGSSTTTARQGGYFELDRTGNGSTTDDPIAILAGTDGTGVEFGGYFDGNQDNSGASQDWAYVGTRIAGTNYSVYGATFAARAYSAGGTNRMAFSPQTPEIIFEDYGTGQLVNGEAKIQLDADLQRNIHVDASHPLKVFIQLEGDCKGVYVTNKSKEGFMVKELQGGNSNVSFSWHIVASKADHTDATGRVVSKHVDVRFPSAPKKMAKKQIRKLEMQQIAKPQREQ